MPARSASSLKDDATYTWDEGKMQMSISFSGMEAF
jgi:hypothetical protein